MTEEEAQRVYALAWGARARMSTFRFARSNDPRVIRACAAARAHEPFITPYVRVERRVAEVDLTRASAFARYVVMKAIRTEFERVWTGRARQAYARFERRALQERALP